MSCKVTQHTDTNTDNMNINTTDKINTHKGNMHLEEVHANTHRCVYNRHTLRHTHAHRCILTVTVSYSETCRHTQTHTHTDRHILRLSHKDPHPNIYTYRNTHSHTNPHTDTKTPRQKNTLTHTGESNKHLSRC